MRKIICLFMFTLISCLSKNYDFIKLQNDIKSCDTYSDVLSVYSKYDILPSKDETFIKTKILILNENIKVFLNITDEGNEVLDERSNKMYVFKQNNIPQTIIIKKSGIYNNIIIDDKDDKIEFIITQVEKKIIIFNKKSEKLIVVDSNLY
ncbi:hypothetical protein [uncultured Chryseobacterium sp.]|uniref:hypothetical protein n=1 Tax=uncultured Chryseobacterium sp. TaxID=259322 RepID=UPI003747B7C9